MTIAKGIQLYGARLYLNFIHIEDIPLYLGLEGDIVKFNLTDISGNGFMFPAFVGGEYYMSKTFSISLDVGPVYTKLNEKSDSEITVNGIDWVANITIYYYFW